MYINGLRNRLVLIIKEIYNILPCLPKNADWGLQNSHFIISDYKDFIFSKIFKKFSNKLFFKIESRVRWPMYRFISSSHLPIFSKNFVLLLGCNWSVAFRSWLKISKRRLHSEQFKTWQEFTHWQSVSFKLFGSLPAIQYWAQWEPVATCGKLTWPRNMETR